DADDMEAEIALHDPADRTLTEREGHVLEFLDHPAPSEPAEVASELGGARIVRISPRERRKVFPLPQPLQEGVRLGSCSLSRLLRGVRHDHDLPERQEPRTLLQLRARVLEA